MLRDAYYHLEYTLVCNGQDVEKDGGYTYLGAYGPPEPLGWEKYDSARAKKRFDGWSGGMLPRYHLPDSARKILKEWWEPGLFYGKVRIGWGSEWCDGNLEDRIALEPEYDQETGGRKMWLIATWRSSVPFRFCVNLSNPLANEDFAPAPDIGNPSRNPCLVSIESRRLTKVPNRRVIPSFLASNEAPTLPGGAMFRHHTPPKKVQGNMARGG
jgi:hypothetical protein